MCLPNRHRSSALSSRGHSRCWQGAKENAASASRGDGRSAKKKIISAFTRSKTRPSEAGEGVGREWWLGGSAILYRIVRRWHWDRDLERSGNQACGVWRNDVPGRRDSQCEGSEARTWFVCLGTSKEATWLEVSGWEPSFAVEKDIFSGGRSWGGLGAQIL